MTGRIIALVDMDCFFAQVEQGLNPKLKGKPCAVVQYTPIGSGGIIAVNYEARALGVTRHMNGKQAKEKCPNVALVRAPGKRGKPDTSRYRDAGKKVLDVLCQFSPYVEKASIDEAYLDLTEVVKKKQMTVDYSQLKDTFVCGREETEQGIRNWLTDIYENNDPDEQRLAIAAVIVEEIRDTVFKETGYHCSAGISNNKMLAKLAAGFHKPKKQTVLPQSAVPELFQTLPTRKLRNLGGKLGDILVDELGYDTMGQIAAMSLQELTKQLGDRNGPWLYNAAKGIDTEKVVSRQLLKSIGCGKNFPGRSMLTTKEKVQHWLSQLAEELIERLQKDFEDNKRVAKLLTVHFGIVGNSESTSINRSCQLVRYSKEKMCQDIMAILKKFNREPPQSDAWNPAIVHLSLAASKFQEDCSKSSIKNFFTASSSPVKAAAAGTSKTDTEVYIAEEITIDDDESTDGYTAMQDNNAESDRDPIYDCETDTDSRDEPEPETDFTEDSTGVLQKSKPTKLLEPDFTDDITDMPQKLKLTQFFEPETDFTEDSSDVPQKPGPALEPGTVTDVCAKCKKEIKITEIVEHMDFHLAQEIQKSFSTGASSSSVSTKSSSAKPTQSRKRKVPVSGRGKDKKNGSTVKTKKLEDYFSKTSEN